MTAQKETAPAVQAEAVNQRDSAHVSANDDRQLAASSQAAKSVCLDTAAAFLARFNPAPIAFRTFTDAKGADKPKGRDRLARNLHEAFTACGPELARLNDQGAGVYFVVNAGGQKAEDVSQVRALFVDLDGSPLDPVMRCALAPHLVVETSAGRYHAYWLVKDFPLEQFSEVQQALARRFNGDPSVHDLPRVMRVPGFRHRSGFRLRVVHEIDAAPYDGKYFMLPEATTPGVPADDDGISLAPETIEDLRSALAALDPDDRDQWQKNAHRLKDLGLRGFLLWDEWAQRSAKHDPNDSLRVWKSAKPKRTGYPAVFSDAQAAGWINPAETRGKARKVAARPRIQRASDLMAREFQPVKWAIRDLLPEGVGLLVGPPKIGKSWLSLQLAVSISAGLPVWAGREPEQPGEVLMLALEDHDRRLQKRFQKMMSSRTTYEQDGPSVIDWKAKTPDVSGIHFATEWASMGEGGIEELDAWLAEHPDARLVIIDTLGRFKGRTDARRSAYELDYEVGAKLKPIADKYGVAILMLHHNRKQKSDDPLESVSGTQGLAGSVDSLLILTRLRGSPDAGLYVTGRDIEREEEYRLLFDSETCAWRAGSKTSAGAAARSPEQAALLDFLAENGASSVNVIAEAVGRPESAVRAALSVLKGKGQVTNPARGAWAIPPSE